MMKGSPMTDSDVQPRKRPIIIVGMERSGTSIVANLVHRWGAYGGNPDQLSEGNEGNLHGYWEHELLSEFTRLLSRADGIPDFWGHHFGDLWHPDFVERITAKAADPQWRDLAAGLISMMGDQGRIWFFKEPYTSLFLPFWKKIWGSATYVITVRNPYDSAVSWHKFTIPEDARSRINTVAANLLRWQVMMLSVLENTQDSDSTIFVPYEDLVSKPREQCRRLCDFLSDEYSLERFDDDQLEYVAGAVDQMSWRNRSSAPFADVSIATEAQKSLYDFLLQKVANPNLPFDAAQYPIYPGWREYLANVDTLKVLYERFLLSQERDGAQ